MFLQGWSGRISTSRRWVRPIRNCHRASAHIFGQLKAWADFLTAMVTRTTGSTAIGQSTKQVNNQSQNRHMRKGVKRADIRQKYLTIATYRKPKGFTTI